MSSSSQVPKKKTKGRQKMEMKKMENETNLQVTFSKRRSGLFKKASELCTLCAAEAAIVVFSPANKAYCFGHPNAETVANRFLNELPPGQTTDLSQLIIESQRSSTIRGLNFELTQLEGRLAMEKKRSEKLDEVRKLGQLQKWYPESLDELNYSQLQRFKEGILELKKNFDAEVQKGMRRLLNPHPFHPLGGGENDQNDMNPSGFSIDVGSSVRGDVPIFSTPTPIRATEFSSLANYNYTAFAPQLPNYDPRVINNPNAPFPIFDPKPSDNLSSVVHGYDNGVVTNASNDAVFAAGANNGIAPPTFFKGGYGGFNNSG